MWALITGVRRHAEGLLVGGVFTALGIYNSIKPQEPFLLPPWLPSWWPFVAAVIVLDYAFIRAYHDAYEELWRYKPRVRIRRHIGTPNEPWLDWLHVEAENVSDEDIEHAWVECWVEGHALPFSMVRTGSTSDTFALPAHKPVQIPVATMAHEDHPDAPIYGVVLPAGRCHVSDIRHLKDHVVDNEQLIMPGQHRLKIVLHNGPDQVEDCFYINVPDPDSKRLSLMHVVCGDS